ncbi:ERF family protein [Bacillus thuringiensis]|uniref:ERF family protein n=1 Tax=Bacillus thuringiensis TaxID=1428 RepID=UPI00211D1D2A|nr:ERF family protein [Bacillus thuringiensis]
MNLWQKLVAIRKDIDVFVKNGKSYGYDYVTGSQILHKIKKNMDELQVILMPKMGEHKTWQYSYKNQKGRDITDFVIEGDGFYEWINAEKPEERETIPWKFFGQQDDVSKAYGSALTYSERYFLLKFFGIPTDEDDADARDTKGKQRTNSYNNQNKQQSGNGQAKASEKQMKMIHAKIAHISVLSKTDKQTIEDTLKGNVGIETLSEISSQIASKAIQVLSGWENKYSKTG